MKGSLWHSEFSQVQLTCIREPIGTSALVGVIDAQAEGGRWTHLPILLFKSDNEDQFRSQSLFIPVAK